MDHHPQTPPKFMMPEETRMISGPPTRVFYRDKWAERLWPCMSWSIFLFNLLMCSDFAIEVLSSDNYDYTKHLTIAATMCASYIVLMWAHKNILRKDNGLD